MHLSGWVLFTGSRSCWVLKFWQFIWVEKFVSSVVNMACCPRFDIREGTKHATNSISILPKGFPQPISKMGVKNTTSTQYSTDMELDQNERQALNELLLALDAQRPGGLSCCCCGCTQKRQFENVVSKIEEMHMEYRINASCNHISQVLLTKTGNVVKAKPSDNKTSEVPHGVLLFPGLKLIVCNHILSDEERAEILNLQQVGSRQCINISCLEMLYICVVGTAYGMGTGILVTLCAMGCMCCFNCSSYNQLRQDILSSGATHSVSILEEWCCTVNTVEYRNFSFPVHHFDPSAMIEMGTMER